MYRGIFPAQFLSLNSIFNEKLKNSIIPRIFRESSRTLEFLLEMTYFLPSSTNRVFFPCNYWPWTWFSTLAHTQRENLEFPGISLLLPFSKYRIFLLLSINPCTWFSMFQFKSPSFLESSWKYLEILNSSENGLILTKFEK